MSTEAAEPSTDQPTSTYLPLRIWPAVLLLAAIPITRYLRDVLAEPPIPIMFMGVFGPLACAALAFIWWNVFSRASAKEKIVGSLGIVACLGLSVWLMHKSLSFPGMLLIAIPLGFATFTFMSIVCSKILSFRRTVLILVATACAILYPTLLRNNEGMSGDFKLDLSWRWEPSAEEIMLAEQAGNEPKASSNLTEVDEALADSAWPAFRGPDRSGIQYGSIINADWKSHPPKELWKVPIGPGWSSFVVAGNLLFTQEQRGSEETVVCLDAETGERIWNYKYETRWDDPLGGPGPRATPTLANGGLYTLGPNGHLTRLDPKTGKEVWQKNIKEVANREPPQWGFSSSPLVTDGLVIVHAGGEKDKGVLAFDCDTGELKWGAPSGDHSYSSPHLADIFGKTSVLMVSNSGVDILDPMSGDSRLNYEWITDEYRALQPKVLGEDLLVPSGMGVGMGRVHLTDNEGKLSGEQLWTSKRLKGDFNDAVLYQDHLYGFDGSIFTCISIEDGERQWKRGRYGSGQVLLLAETGHLLITSEEGELVLLEANPEKHVELAKIPALEGKTWNHPVLIGDRLYIRNSQEAACYRLKLQEDGVDPETPLAAAE